jgi:hypothetical protein
MRWRIHSGGMPYQTGAGCAFNLKPKGPNMAKQIENTIPSYGQAAGPSDLAKSHLPPGASSMVNGVPYYEVEEQTFQVVNGVKRPAGTITRVRAGQR